MANAFQVFRDRSGPYEAIPVGPAWMALPLPWLWAAQGRLWFRALFLVAFDLLVVALAPSLMATQGVALALVLAVPRVITWLAGHGWRAADLEDRGFEYLGEIVASGRKDAVAQVARREGVIPSELRHRPTASAFAFPPKGFQPIWSVARLTVYAAFRYRLVLVLIAMVVGTVVVLPTIIKHDETAQGFTQILLTYTLGITSALLSLVTLWLACGTLARDVDECQMQVVATKPIPRWQIWLGKWMGIMLLNGMLLSVAGGAVYLLMQWRATQLPAEVQQSLRSNILTARASLKEPPPDIEAEVDKLIRDRLPELQSRGVNIEAFRAQARENIKSRQQVVPPNHFRRYRFDFSDKREALQGKPVFARLKFYTPEFGAKRPYDLEVTAGPEDSAARIGAYRSLAAEASHEIELLSPPLDAQGMLIIDVANRSDVPLMLPFDEGFEMLYAEGGFGLNYVRALLVVACWLGLLAAIGLAAASFLSFPVAAFLATTVLLLGLSTGTMKSVVEDRTVLGMDHDSNERLYPMFDAVMVPVFEVVLNGVNLVQQFSPISSVSTGRSITWADLGSAFALVIVVFGGCFAAVGIIAFTRRELATAQSNH